MLQFVICDLVYFCKLRYKSVPGERKSGMPAPTLIPAPVITCEAR